MNIINIIIIIINLLIYWDSIYSKVALTINSGTNWIYAMLSHYLLNIICRLIIAAEHIHYRNFLVFSFLTLILIFNFTLKICMPNQITTWNLIPQKL